VWGNEVVSSSYLLVFSVLSLSYWHLNAPSYFLHS
jgi:hypothetical protein